LVPPRTLHTIGLSILLSGVLLAASACSRDAAPERGERRIADLAELARAPRDPATKPRLLVIGIDGASWDYIDPLIAAGELPNLARLRREGASARLRSVPCHFTPPAWTTMFTGMLPPRTGVYSFGSWDPETRTFRTVSARDVAVPALWDVASAAGLRVASVGVPVTYPARAIHGVQVGGLDTPKNHGPQLRFTPAAGRLPPGEAGLESFAPPLSAALEDEHNLLFPIFRDSLDDGVPKYDRVRLRVIAKGTGPQKQRTLGRFDFPVGEFSPWVRVRAERDGGALDDAFLKLQFESPDAGFRASPSFFRIDQPYTHPRELAAELEKQFGYYLPHEFLPMELVPAAARDGAEAARWFLAREPWDLFLFVFGESDNAHHLVGFDASVLPVYREIDALLGEAMSGLDARTTLAVVSDHGFGEFDETVDLNQFLAELGLLRWLRPGEIDHDQSVVFHHMWHLYFDAGKLTAEELSRRGVEIRSGESPRQALARHLQQAARGIRAPDGRALPIELTPVPEGAVGDAPDMAVTGYPDRVWVEFWNLQHPGDALVSPLAEGERWKHARDGIAAFYGARIEPGDLGTLEIQDVAPTLLDLLDLPLADGLDGRAIAGALTREAASRPLVRVGSYPARAPLEGDAADAQAEFEATLRALGYVRD
jgi:predicted AlkP superfamily phosphohydrolase/phosphomutase